jgi:hypothetical protein
LGQEGIRKLVEQSFEQSGVKVLLYQSQCCLYSLGYGSARPALPTVKVERSQPEAPPRAIRVGWS